MFYFISLHFEVILDPNIYIIIHCYIILTYPQDYEQSI